MTRVMTALESAASRTRARRWRRWTAMLAAAWQHLARYQAMAQAVSELLSPEAVTRTHQAAHQALAAPAGTRPGRRLLPDRRPAGLAGDRPPSR